MSARFRQIFWKMQGNRFESTSLSRFGDMGPKRERVADTLENRVDQ